MAVLGSTDRANISAEWQRDRSAVRDTLPLLKADIRAAVDAIDAWLDTNAAAFNSTIPQPARGALTTQQKADLLVYVAKRRYELS